MSMIRRTLREQIFKLLFRVDFLSEEEMLEQEELFFESGDQTYTEEDRKEISEKYEKILENLPEIDEELKERTENWDLNRIGRVELTILRLAVYEIKMDDTIPEKVAINEAVELARKFGQDSAPAFVNAVLARFTEEGAKKEMTAPNAEDKEKKARADRQGDAKIHLVHTPHTSGTKKKE